MTFFKDQPTQGLYQIIMDLGCSQVFMSVVKLLIHIDFVKHKQSNALFEF
eukprot:UN23325